MDSDSPDISTALKNQLSLMEECFGHPVWSHTALVFTRWTAVGEDGGRRRAELKQTWSDRLCGLFPAIAKARPAGDPRLPAYFIDTASVTERIAEEVQREATQGELDRLFALVQLMGPLSTTSPAPPPAAAPKPAAAQQPRPATPQARPPPAAPQPVGDWARAGLRVDAADAVEGAFVKRSETWTWGNQDGGPGRVGCIVKVEPQSRWVAVLWRNGNRNRYRAGVNGKYDLRYASRHDVESIDSSLKQAISAGVRPSPHHLQRNFGYAAGVVRQHFSRFDVRDEVCIAAGGFKHGDVVVLRAGKHDVRAVTIGAKPEDGIVKLWFHLNGADGAGLFEDADKKRMRKSGREVLLEAQREDFAGASDDDMDNETMERLALNLRPTFGYPTGTGMLVEHKLFDIRDEVCKMFGFSHGQVVKDPPMVVIGVAKALHGRPTLHFHVNGAPGAGVFPSREFALIRGGLRVVGVRRLEAVPETDARFGVPEDLDRLEEIGESLRLNFGYAAGTLAARYALFDVRDQVCREVGGFRHGQVVKLPDGSRATVIGVRMEHDKPQLFFHCEGAPGAGVFPSYSRVRSLLKADGLQKVKEMLPTDPAFRHAED